MKALIGMIESGHGIACIEIDEIVLDPPHRNPGDVLAPWATTASQLQGLLHAGPLREMHPHALIFPDDGDGRFRGARMLRDQDHFLAASADAGTGLAALYDASDARDGTQATWRIWWPWNGGGSEAAREAGDMLERVLVELRCAQDIFNVGRDLKGKHGQAMRANARHLAASAGTLCAANHGSALMDSMTAIGLPNGHLRMRDQLLGDIQRASEGSHHVGTTEQALSAALGLAGAIHAALQNRIAQGVLASLDAPAWIPGNRRDVDAHEPVQQAAA